MKKSIIYDVSYIDLYINLIFRNNTVQFNGFIVLSQTLNNFNNEMQYYWTYRLHWKIILGRNSIF